MLGRLSTAAFSGWTLVLASCAMSTQIDSATPPSFWELREAVRDGNARAVRRVLSAGADVNSTNSDGRSVLHDFVSNNSSLPPIYRELRSRHYAMPSLLREYGFHFRHQDNRNGEGILQSNIKVDFYRDDYRFLQALIDAGAPVTDGAMGEAAKWKKTELLAWLMARGGNPNATAALLQAARYYRSTPQLLRMLLDAGAIGPADPDERQAIRLQLANDGGSEPLSILLQRNEPPRTCPPDASPDDHRCGDAFDLLMAAAQRGHPRTISALAENGVRTASIDRWRDTVLHKFTREDASARRRADSRGAPPPPFPTEQVQQAFALAVRYSPDILQYRNRTGHTVAQLAEGHPATKAWFDRVVRLAAVG